MDMMLTEDMGRGMYVACQYDHVDAMVAQYNIDVYGDDASGPFPLISWRDVNLYYCRACGEYYEIDQDDNRLLIGDVIIADGEIASDGLCGCND